MASKNLWKNVKRDWTKASGIIKQKHKTYANNKVLPDFLKIVSPFKTSIPFHVVNKMDGSDLVTAIEPTPGMMFERADGQKRDTWQLFQWLNDGTVIRHALIIGPYTQVTRMGNISSRSGGGTSETKVIASKNKVRRPGIEGRNWTQLLIDKHTKGHNREILKGIQMFLKS